MPSRPEYGDRTQGARSRTFGVLTICALGYALTIFVFHPGVMTYDARYIYSYATQKFFEDWQSPVMILLWKAIDPIAPGAASMFLLIISLYWLAFALLALSLARRTWFALALPLLALSPPAFMLVGDIWRDVLFASVWLLAAALAFAVADRNGATKYWVQGLAILLLAFGVLLRPNAVPAAPVLTAYLFWPARWQLKRVLIIYLPVLAVSFALVPVVYYGLIGATKKHPLHQIFVYDLGGITHFAKENQFPVTWTPTESTQLTESCYRPTEWNFYWNIGPCQFVMRRLEAEQLFGDARLVTAWRAAVIRHPIAYLQHRATFMAQFLAGENLTMWVLDIENPPRTVFADRPAFTALLALHETLRSTWLFKPATWLVLCVGLVVLAWPRRGTPAGALVLGVCGSAVIYVATYFPVGVASDFRYSYWAVLAGIAGVVVILSRLFVRDEKLRSAI
jgi:hypothetical protein